MIEKYYDKNGITIYNADYMEILKQLEDETIDLVFTDPPYGISKKNGDIKNIKRSRDIKRDFGEWDYNFEPSIFLSASKRLLNEFGSMIVWTSEQLLAKYRTWFDENMHPRQILVWIKTNPVTQFRKVGYRQATELMFWATKGKISKKNPNFLFLSQKEMINVFYAPIVGGKEREEHPTQKPLSITQEIIRRHCRPDGLILDPFMGSGTTLVGAKILGRRAIGIEINKKYCDIAIKRLEKVQSLF